jgi:hypothetical protein
MNFKKSLYYSFSFLLLFCSKISLTEEVQKPDQFIEDYACISEETDQDADDLDSFFPSFELALGSDSITQFIEELAENDFSEDEEMQDPLDETYVCDLEVLI